LKSPAPGKLPTLPEGILPHGVGLTLLSYTIVGGDIREIGITPRHTLVPTEHGINSFCKLYGILLVKTARIYPDISKAISLSLSHTEVYLLLSSFDFTGACSCVLKDNFLLPPSMSKYSVGRDVFAGEFG
jgi:hypothetical protein